LTELPAELRPDCAACAALCCVAPAFDAAQGFGFDKPAEVPCPNLQSDFRCGIHDRLIPAGFPGCVRYDCFGAGQRVMREFAPRGNWRDAPQEAGQLFAVFARLRSLHELKALVHYALGRSESRDSQAALLPKLRQIEDLCRSADVDSSARDARGLRDETLQILRSILPAPPIS